MFTRRGKGRQIRIEYKRMNAKLILVVHVLLKYGEVISRPGTIFAMLYIKRISSIL